MQIDKSSICNLKLAICNFENSLSSGERKGKSLNLPCASHKEIPITKHQIPKNWNLEIGIWDFLVRSTRWGLWGKEGGEILGELKIFSLAE
jgi:hypothetical protein